MRTNNIWNGKNNVDDDNETKITIVLAEANWRRQIKTNNKQTDKQVTHEKKTSTKEVRCISIKPFQQPAKKTNNNSKETTKLTNIKKILAHFVEIESPKKVTQKERKSSLTKSNSQAHNHKYIYRLFGAENRWCYWRVRLVVPVLCKERRAFCERKRADARTLFTLLAHNKFKF